jgi:hypothetical protein
MPVDALVRHLAELKSKLTGPSLEYLKSGRYHSDRRTYNQGLEEYAESVPRVTLSRCPICGEPLDYSIDLRGLEYPWWWEKFPYNFAPPKGCSHFLLLQGALDLNGHQPTEVQTWHTRPGPAKPFVIERLMNSINAKVVIGHTQIGERYTGYPIAYFSESPVEQHELHQSWTRDRWTIYNEDGEPITSRSRRDTWSFDLNQYVVRNQLFWIKPNDEQLNLTAEGELPFIKQGASTYPQLIQNGQINTYGPPRGEDVDDFRPHTGYD